MNRAPEKVSRSGIEKLIKKLFQLRMSILFAAKNYLLPEVIHCCLNYYYSGHSNPLRIESFRG